MMVESSGIKDDGNYMTEPITERQYEQIEKHLSLVLEANATTNLTRIIDRTEGEILHVEDSLVGLPELNEAPAGIYADLGSGGGFPGIPLAIASGRTTLLVESVKKKAAFLESFIDRLDLNQRVSVYPGRVEELALERPEAFSAITARALTALPSLLELASPLLREGGHLICYKAADIEVELEAACALKKRLALKLLSKRKVTLSDGKTGRTIIVFEKIGTPTVRLPRRPGMAQKRPYVE